MYCGLGPFIAWTAGNNTFSLDTEDDTEPLLSPHKSKLRLERVLKTTQFCRQVT